jgi:hypothetical protein
MPANSVWASGAVGGFQLVIGSSGQLTLTLSGPTSGAADAGVGPFTATLSEAQSTDTVVDVSLLVTMLGSLETVPSYSGGTTSFYMTNTNAGIYQVGISTEAPATIVGSPLTYTAS